MDELPGGDLPRLTMDGTVVAVLKGYPRLSETFIAQELLALEQAGMNLVIASLRQPTDATVHEIHRKIQAEVLYLPEFPGLESERVFRAWTWAKQQPGYPAAQFQWLKDLGRAPSDQRAKGFAQAMCLAFEAPEDTQLLYAHFLHWPGSVTRYAAMLRGLPWSCSAHAVDIWTLEDWEKREKLESMEWLATCTAANANHLSALADDPAKVELVYHGLDFGRFPDAPEPDAARDGSTEDRAVRLISVGRAVEKKGYPTILDALARLPADLHWHFTHIGGGPDLDALTAQAASLGLTDRISWLGALPQDKVIQAYRDADIFVLASRITASGDRDGLPNVMMEAQSQALACVATEVSAIPELLIQGETGVMVPPENPVAMGEALEKVISDPTFRASLARAGCTRVRADFAHGRGVSQLIAKFNALPEPSDTFS